jgi:transposase
MMRRYGLRDDQWEKSTHVLPGREETVGVTAKAHRLFVAAGLYRYRAGLPWRDRPARFGEWNNIPRRHRRWSERGVWRKVFEHLAAEAENAYAMIDSTIVRAHQPAAGAKGGRPPGEWPPLCHAAASRTDGEAVSDTGGAGAVVARCLRLSHCWVNQPLQS